LRKITAEDLSGKGVIGLADTPGLSANELQRRFEETAREIIIPAYNELVEELQGEGGANAIGLTPPETFPTADTVQKAVDQMAVTIKEQGDDLSQAITDQGEEFTEALNDQDTELRQYVDDTLQAIGAADMQSAVYDPQHKATDIFDYADDAAETAAENTIGKTLLLTYAKSSTTHALTGLSGAAGTLSCVFTATADYAKGDTFTVDGESYTVKQQNGEEADDGLFVTGAKVGVIIDTQEKSVNFKSGGGGGFKVGDIIPAAQIEEYRDPSSPERELLTTVNLSTLTGTSLGNPTFAYQRADGSVLFFTRSGTNTRYVVLYDATTQASVWSSGALYQATLLAVDDDYIYTCRCNHTKNYGQADKKHYIEKRQASTGEIVNTITFTSPNTFSTYMSGTGVVNCCDTLNYLLIHFTDTAYPEDSESSAYYCSSKLLKIKKEDFTQSTIWQQSSSSSQGQTSPFSAPPYSFLAGFRNSDSFIVKNTDGTLTLYSSGLEALATNSTYHNITVYDGDPQKFWAHAFVYDNDTKLFVCNYYSPSVQMLLSLPDLQNLKDVTPAQSSYERFNPNTLLRLFRDSSAKTVSAYDMDGNLVWVADYTNYGSWNYPAESNDGVQLYAYSGASYTAAIATAGVTGYIIKEATE